MRKIGARWTMAGTYALMAAAMSMIILSQDFFALLIASALLGVSVCPIWIFALANVDEATRGKDMGFIFFSWVSVLGSGMILMNLTCGAVWGAAVGVLI